MVVFIRKINGVFFHLKRSHNIIRILWLCLLNKIATTKYITEFNNNREIQCEIKYIVKIGNGTCVSDAGCGFNKIYSFNFETTNLKTILCCITKRRKQKKTIFFDN